MQSAVSLRKSMSISCPPKSVDAYLSFQKEKGRFFQWPTRITIRPSYKERWHRPAQIWAFIVARLSIWVRTSATRVFGVRVATMAQSISRPVTLRTLYRHLLKRTSKHQVDGCCPHFRQHQPKLF